MLVWVVVVVVALLLLPPPPPPLLFAWTLSTEVGRDRKCHALPPSPTWRQLSRMRLVHLASSPSLPPAASGVSATAAAAAAALVLVILSCAVAPAGGCHSRHHHDFRDQVSSDDV